MWVLMGIVKIQNWQEGAGSFIVVVNAVLLQLCFMVNSVLTLSVLRVVIIVPILNPSVSFSFLYLKQK